MSLQNDYTEWLKGGRQRAAVAQVLRKPMTATEICVAARAISPRIQLRDVSFLIRQFERQGLIMCLDPRPRTGAVYSLSDKGRAAVLSTFGLCFEAPPEGIDWHKYSLVARAKIRQLGLRSLARLQEKTQLPQTAAQIRKHIREQQSISLSPLLRSLNELLKLKLIECAGVTKKQSRRLFRLTPTGMKILEQLRH